MLNKYHNTCPVTDLVKMRLKYTSRCARMKVWMMAAGKNIGKKVEMEGVNNVRFKILTSTVCLLLICEGPLVSPDYIYCWLLCFPPPSPGLFLDVMFCIWLSGRTYNSIHPSTHGFCLQL